MSRSVRLGAGEELKGSSICCVDYCEEGMFPFCACLHIISVYCFVSPIVVCSWVIGPVVLFSCLLCATRLVCPVVTVHARTGMLGD